MGRRAGGEQRRFVSIPKQPGQSVQLGRRAEEVGGGPLVGPRGTGRGRPCGKDGKGANGCTACRTASRQRCNRQPASQPAGCHVAVRSVVYSLAHAPTIPHTPHSTSIRTTHNTAPQRLAPIPLQPPLRSPCQPPPPRRRRPSPSPPPPRPSRSQSSSPRPVPRPAPPAALPRGGPRHRHRPAPLSKSPHRAAAPALVVLAGRHTHTHTHTQAGRRVSEAVWRVGRGGGGFAWLVAWPERVARRVWLLRRCTRRAACAATAPAGGNRMYDPSGHCVPPPEPAAPVGPQPTPHTHTPAMMRIHYLAPTLALGVEYGTPTQRHTHTHTCRPYFLACLALSVTISTCSPAWVQMEGRERRGKKALGTTVPRKLAHFATLLSSTVVQLKALGPDTPDHLAASLHRPQGPVTKPVTSPQARTIACLHRCKPGGILGHLLLR